VEEGEPQVLVEEVGGVQPSVPGMLWAKEVAGGAEGGASKRH